MILDITVQRYYVPCMFEMQKSSYEEHILKILDELRIHSLIPARQKKNTGNIHNTWHKNPKAACGLHDSFDFLMGELSQSGNL